MMIDNCCSMMMMIMVIVVGGGDGVMIQILSTMLLSYHLWVSKRKKNTPNNFRSINHTVNNQSINWNQKQKTKKKFVQSLTVKLELNVFFLLSWCAAATAAGYSGGTRDLFELFVQKKNKKFPEISSFFIEKTGNFFFTANSNYQ